jgi:hypothetical protein
MLTPQIESALARMTELEKNVSRLYAAYSRRFPAYEGLWSTLSKEETEHSAWILELTEQARLGKVKIASSRFKAEAVQMALDSIAKHIAEAETGNPPLLHCLSIAMDLENALIEKEYFMVFEGDSVEIRDTLNRLAAATRNHHRMVRQAWLAMRQMARG